MNCVNYKIDPTWLVERQAEVLDETGRTEAQALAVAVKSIASNIERKPGRYLAYGPYWWALKTVMKAAGIDYGSDDAPIIRKAYEQATPLLTILAADAFREDYDSSMIQGVREFTLSDDEDDGDWTLFDRDMEQRIGMAA